MLPTRPYRALFEVASRLFALPHWRGRAPFIWLEAMALQESSGNSNAYRYEPGLDYRSPRDSDAPGVDNLSFEDDKSYGLMQLLGSTYKEVFGIPQESKVEFKVLFNPFVNVACAIVYLQHLLGATGKDVGRALARYNGGTRGDEVGPGHTYRNQAYVDAVWGRVLAVEADRAKNMFRVGGSEVH